jgi:hypothetical protein
MAGKKTVPDAPPEAIVAALLYNNRLSSLFEFKGHLSNQHP